MLYDKLQKSGSFNEHENHLDLYNALIGSIHLDDKITKGEIDPTKHLKMRRHADKDEDHLAGKTPSKPSSTDKSVNAKETVHESAMKADATMEVEDDVTWFHELVNVDKNPLAFEDLMGSTFDFTKFSMHRIKKDKITKADLEGPAYNLLIGTYQNNIELEYNPGAMLPRSIK
nr:hypothetical protein [Tanacetum cinerariifolium]